MSKVQLDFDQLVADHGEGVYRLCRAYVGNIPELDDLYQEALINIWKALPGFRGDAKITTWIYRVTVNTSVTYRRKTSRKTSLETHLDDFSHISIDSEDRDHKLKLEEQYQLLLKAIEKLKADQRIIIGLFLEDLSYKEIGEVIGKDTNYVGVKLSRIKEKLSKLIK